MWSCSVAAAAIWTSSTRYGLLDSAYFAVTTVSTTGYGDITPLHEGAGLKLGVMGLMLIGALSLALIYALITDAVVGVRLSVRSASGRGPRRDHVVVLGLGRIGQRVVEDLVARRIPCIAVERNEDAPGCPCRAPAARAGRAGGHLGAGRARGAPHPERPAA